MLALCLCKTPQFISHRAMVWYKVLKYDIDGVSLEGTRGEGGRYKRRRRRVQEKGEEGTRGGGGGYKGRGRRVQGEGEEGTRGGGGGYKGRGRRYKRREGGYKGRGRRYEEVPPLQTRVTSYDHSSHLFDFKGPEFHIDLFHH